MEDQEDVMYPNSDTSLFEYYTNYRFRVVQSASAFFLHGTALILLLRIAKRLSKGNFKDVSLMLRTFLGIWILEDLLAMPYAIVITVFWRPVYLSYYKRLSLYVVLWERSFSCAVPIAVFSLTLDRCMALLLGLKYRIIHARVQCVLCCGLVVAVSSSSIYFYLVAAFASAGEKASLELTCQSTFCFLSRPDDWQFFVRVTFGSLNFVCSIAFLLLLRCRMCKHAAFDDNAAARASVNSFIAYALASEVLLNFLPHAGCLVYELVTGDGIAKTFGTYSRFVTSLDALACAAIYYRKIGRRNRVTSIEHDQTCTTAVPSATTCRIILRIFKKHASATATVRPI